MLQGGPHCPAELAQTRGMKIARIGLAAFVALCACSGRAAEWTPSSAFIAEGGVTMHGTYSLTAGVTWPWTWHRISHTGEWTGMTELFVSRWSGRLAGGRVELAQLGIVPILRYRLDHGRSNWFGEGGIGLSYMDRLYRTDRKQFSTRFNFYDTVGIGRSFGAQREHELSLRLTHVSNGGVKKPNPGENFVQLRYAHAF
jgi:lipid A 3-O-deacylase